MDLDPRYWDVATDRQREYLDAIKSEGGVRAAARKMGVLHNNVLRTLDSVKRKVETASKTTPGFSPRQITRQYDATGVLTGESVSEGVAPWAEPGGEDAGPARDGKDGYFVKGVSTYYDAAGEQRGQWVKTSVEAADVAAMLKAMAQGLADDLPRAEPVVRPNYCDQDLLTFYPQGDPHAGLYSWKEETGSHFDLAEFERINRLAIDRLVAASPAAATAIFNDKGDSTHADNSKNRTPRSGHELDVHGRHSEVIRTVMRLKRYQVLRLLEKHERVVYRIDTGNHDQETALNLALMVSMIYENEQRIEVSTSPNPYWYYRFGKNLFGTCHGDGAKGQDLPGIMANDAREWWGQAEHCVWFVGHVHHKWIKDYVGCTVEYVRTLAAPDMHSHGSGYRSKRTMEAITYHREDGEVERHLCSMGMIERLAAASDRDPHPTLI